MPDTSLKYFTQVMSVVSLFDISEEACLKAAGLTELPTSNRVSANVVVDIFNYVAKKLDDPLIGIKCGLKYPILQYTRPAEILKLCADLDHAARTYNTYCPLFNTIGTPSRVISEGGTDRMIWTPNFDQNLIGEYRQLTEFVMTNLITSINWLAWKTPNAVFRLNIQHEPSLPLEHYENLFGCEIWFGQDEYSLMLKPGVRDDPFSMANPSELAKICTQYDLLLNELYAEQSLLDRVELQIRRGIENRKANKEVVAKSLGLSERSMTRALREKGTCFKDIKTRILKDLAILKIEQGQPLVEIAYSLGYNDQPAFTRAFKRWFGVSPGKRKIDEKLD